MRRFPGEAAGASAGTPIPHRMVWNCTADQARNEPIVQSEGRHQGYFVSTTSQNTASIAATRAAIWTSHRALYRPPRPEPVLSAGAALGNVAFVDIPPREAFAIGRVGRLALGEGSTAPAGG
jgi:hypothetical protein